MQRIIQVLLCPSTGLFHGIALHDHGDHGDQGASAVGLRALTSVQPAVLVQVPQLHMHLCVSVSACVTCDFITCAGHFMDVIITEMQHFQHQQTSHAMAS